jgi:hypothetical protein
MKIKKLWGAIGVLLLTVCVSSCVQAREKEPVDSGNNDPHVHTSASAVKENVTESTCEQEGSYESVVYCSVCGEELSRTEETVPITHQYEDEKCLLCGQEKPSDGLNFKSNGNKTCSVSGIGSCKDHYIKIPTVSPEGDTVTGIADRAFQQCEGITGVRIPDTVTKIGDYAFSHCTGLQEISLPDSLKTIGKYAFLECTGLTDVKIPDSVISLQTGAFQNCSELISVTLPKNITYIADLLFMNCGELVNVVIPSRVTMIGQQSFQHCKSLEYIVIPASVKTIESFAFMNCSGLERMRFEAPREWYYYDPQSGENIGYMEPTSEDMNALNLTFRWCEYTFRRQ